jgi:hypothetical protein
MTPPDDHLLAVARRVETILGKIAYAEDPAEVHYLQQRAVEAISELPLAISRARLSERVDDAANARLQELET